MSAPGIAAVLWAVATLLPWMASSGVAQVVVELDPGRPVEGAIAAGQEQSFRVEVCAECHLWVILEQNDVDLVLVVRSEGTEDSPVALRLDSPSGRQGREIGLVAGRRSGRWILTVEAGPATGQGRFFLLAREVSLAEWSSERLEAEQRWTEASAAYLAGGGEARRALARLAELLPIFRDQLSTRRGAEALALAAELARATGDPEQARGWLGEAAELWRASGELLQEARVLASLGFVAWRLGEVAEALEIYQRGLDLARSHGDLYTQAQLLNNLGHAHLYRGEHEEAQTHFLLALGAARQANVPRFEATLLNNLGGVRQVLGEPDEARGYFERAREIWASLDEKVQEARTLANLGAVERASGDYSRALNRYLAARRRFVAAGDQGGEATTLNSIGAVYLALGEPTRAELFLRQALPLRRAAGDRRGEAATLHNLGRCAQANGQHEPAREAYSRALQLRRELKDRRGEATTLDFLGTLELAAGRPGAALATLEPALELRQQLGDRRLVARTLRHIGEGWNGEGRPGEALKFLDRVLAFELELGEEMERSAALHAHASADLALGDVASAARNLRRALELAEGNTRVIPDADLEASFLAERQPLYELAVEVAMAQHRAQPDGGHHLRALEISERSKARGLLAMLAESGIEIRRGVSPELLTQRRQLTARIAGKALARRRVRRRGDTTPLPQRLEADLLDLLVRAEALEGEIRQQSEAYADLSRPRTLVVAEIQPLLDADTLLLEYFLGAEASYLWAVTREEVTVHSLPPRHQVEEACRRLVEGWSHHNLGNTANNRAATHLADLLLGPVADRLGRRHLAVVADGALHYLPFAALPRPGAVGDEGVGEPLLARNEVVHLPSVSVLMELRRRRGSMPRSSGLPAATLAILADPSFSKVDSGTATWSQLPWSRREAESIAALVPPDSSLVALGTEANRELAIGGRLNGYRFVHLATHGVLDSEVPSLSGLALATVDDQGRPRRGFLGLQDVYNLDLSAELVVLSGCRTALGKEIRGEGLVGLARGFLSSGAQRVIASLWPVQDRVTAELMVVFYRYLLAEGQTPASALRSAQQEVRSQLRWRDPYFWAGFVLVGDWESTP